MGNQIQKVCKVCGKEFVVYPSQPAGKYCSRACYYQSRRLPRVTKVCIICGKSIVTKNQNQKVCSHACRNKYLGRIISKSNRKYTQEVACEYCGKVFVPHPNRGSRFCSRDCYLKWDKSGENGFSWKGGKSIQIICEECGKHFDVYPCNAGTRFCSLGCVGRWRSKHMRGENSPNWLGGKSFEQYPPEFDATLKKTIRERDKNKCAICWLFGKDVHHIDYDKHDNRPTNLITLCRSCHTATNAHREYWEGVLSKLIVARESAQEVYYGVY